MHRDREETGGSSAFAAAVPSLMIKGPYPPSPSHRGQGREMEEEDRPVEEEEVRLPAEAAEETCR